MSSNTVWIIVAVLVIILVLILVALGVISRRASGTGAPTAARPGGVDETDPSFGDARLDGMVDARAEQPDFEEDPRLQGMENPEVDQRPLPPQQAQDTEAEQGGRHRLPGEKN